MLHRHDLGWLIPFLLWLAITLRIITLYVPTRFILTGINFVWTNAVQKPAHIIPEHLRMWAAAAGTIAVFIIGTFASGETPGNTRGDRAVSLFGLVVFLAGFYITSRDRKMIQWQTVIVGMLAQFILALFVLRTKAGVSSPIHATRSCAHCTFSLIFSTLSPSLQSPFLVSLHRVHCSLRARTLLISTSSLQASSLPLSFSSPSFTCCTTGDGYNGSSRSLQPSSSTP